MTNTAWAHKSRPLWLAAALCALLTLPIAWNAREAISSDGLSYLEVADTAVRLGPANLFTNAYWSPVYPAILAVTMKLFHPSLASELMVVHGIDWAICAATYFSFTYFLINLLAWIHLTHGWVFKDRAQFLATVAFAYTLLFVSNIDSALWLVGPHILMEGCVYLAAGACLRLSLPGSRLYHYVLLGAILAFSYAAKAALFPLSIVLLAIVFIRSVVTGSGRRGAVVAAIVFVLAASPLVAVLSYTKGRLTFGDAGKLTYAFYVSGVPRFWEKGMPDVPLPNAPEKILDHPVILKFNGPYKVTWSYWYDPSYWYEGVHPPFDWHRQVQQFLRTLGLSPKLMVSGLTVFQLAGRWMAIWAGVMAFACFGVRPEKVYRAIGARQVWLFLWPAAAFFTFASVLIEYRYLVPFIILGWITLFIAVSMVMDAGKWIGITATVTAGLLLAYGPGYARELRAVPRRPPGPANAMVTRELRSLGIKPGDQLAGVGFADYAYYARLVGARFTMQILAKDPVALSKLPIADVVQVLAALRASGAKALYSPWSPAFENDSGWVRVAQRDYIRLLQ